MPNFDVDAKCKAFAEIIEGRVVDDQVRVQVCLKGTVLGFPATLEAIGAGWPFGVSYFVETKVVDDPNEQEDPNALKLNILPRVVRGFASFFARILLFEPRGQRIGDKRIDSHFICSFNNSDEALRFFQYPGVYEKLMLLHDYAKFSELLVKAKAGLVLTQPTNFKSLDPDNFRETFKNLADLGQVLFEAF